MTTSTIFLPGDGLGECAGIATDVVGLPDNVYCDGSGRPSSDRIEQFLGLNRKTRRRLEAKSVMSAKEFFGRQEHRLTNFRTRVSSARASRSQIMLQGDPAASWEAVVFSAFSAGWHLRNPDTTDSTVQPAISAEDRSRLIAAGTAKFAGLKPSPIPKGRGVGGMKPEKDDLPAILHCATVVFSELYAQLRDWSDAPPARRTLLANVAFGCFTLFGREVLASCIGLVPDLKLYYQFVLGANKATTVAPLSIPITSAEPQVGATGVDSHRNVTGYQLTLEQLYESIIALAKEGARIKDGLGVLEEIRSLIDSNLPRLSAVLQIDPAFAASLIDEVIDIFSTVGRDLHPIFSDETFVRAFRGGWLRYFDERLKDVVEREYFNDLVGARYSSTAGDYKLVGELQEVNQCRERCEDRVSAIEAALPTANFREKRELERQLIDAQAAKSSALNRARELEEQLLGALLPPNIGFDLLPESDDFVMTYQHFDPSVGEALKFWSWSVPEGDVQHDLDHAVADVDEHRHGNSQLSSAVDSEDIDAEFSEPQPQLTAESEQKAQGPLFDDAFPTNVEIAETLEQNTATVDHKVVEHDDVESPAPTIDITHYFDSPQDARDRLERCRVELTAIPSTAVENIAVLWFSRGHLNFATRVLEVADQIYPDNPERLPASLFRAAFYGMNVWRGDYSTIARSLRHLDALSPKDVGSWLERKPSGRIVPYLCFAATFQTAIFAGNMTIAPRLLSGIVSHFDGPVGRMVDEIVQFCDRNNRLDVDVLRNAPKVDEKAGRARISEQVQEWRDRVVNKQTGWAPARKAMKEILSRPDFESTIDAISDDETGKIAEVRAFADHYRSSETLNELMRESIFSMTSENPSPSQIEGNARSWFLRTIEELIGHADAWLNENIQQLARSDETSKFARKFATMSAASIAHLDEKLTKQVDFEKAAGLSLVRQAIANVAKISEGDLSAVWEQKRADAWLSYPRELLSDMGLEPDLTSQMHWLVDSLAESLDFEKLADEAVQRRNFRHAALLTMHRRDVLGQEIGDALETLGVKFAQEKRDLLKRCELLRSLLDNANIGSLVSDERHYQLSADVEHLQEHLKLLSILDSHAEALESLDSHEKEVAEQFNRKVADLQIEIDELVARARIEQGADSIPQSWLDNVKAALALREVTVVEEMLDHLRKALEVRTPLPADPSIGHDVTAQFLAVEGLIHRQLQSISNPREIWKEVNSLDLGDMRLEGLPHLKSGLEAVVNLRKRIRSLNREEYEQIVEVLNLVGLGDGAPQFTTSTPRSVDFEAIGQFSKLTLQVERAETGRGFAFFDSAGQDRQSVVVITAAHEWTIEDLLGLLEGKAVAERIVFISGRALNVEERNAFARFCKQGKFTVYHIDVVLLAVLACIPSASKNRLRAFLQLSLPWTYLNPYTGSQMQPARPEMRYGRQDDIRRLTTMHSGAAIIFGGRQLGKTTLLNETHRQFNQPRQGQHAFLYQMDGNLDRANLSGNELEKHRASVWDKIYGGAVERKLLNPADGLSTDAKFSAIAAYFQKPNADKILVCLDEIDPILGLDAANNFRIFRELSSLVNTSGDRFKVIIAGLENVRRFADAPNYPLHQLGSAIQVSIMTPGEALMLIREPLSNLGYEFDSVLPINRVMVETNRHPGLIHIFCHYLIVHLAGRTNARVGNVKITSEDIETISRDPEVRDLISNRFEITLNLDLRYKLIAFSLIEQGTSTFSSSRAKGIVEKWAPEVFRAMTEGQFEAFLDELCGLGVLHYLRRVEGGKEYGLRNANILNLAGGRSKIEEKLLRAVDSVRDDDPMSGHAFPDHAQLPSPLTLRDEKSLISEEVLSAEIARTASVTAKSSSYSVGLLVGSEALGLSADWLISTLPAIGLEEPPLHSNRIDRYKGESRSDTEYSNTGAFRRVLIETIIEKRSLTMPVMFIVDITGEMPISHTLDLIDIAHEARMSMPQKGHRVRVVFLLQPKALWRWLSSPLLTSERETQQPIIALDRWSKTALAHLLNRLSLENTTADIDELYESSQGWFIAMKEIVEMRAKKQRATRLRGLGTPALTFTAGKPKQLTEFLGRAGLLGVDWAVPLLSTLPLHEEFDRDDIALQLMELEIDIDVEAAIKWLTTLRVVDSKRKDTFKTAPSISKALEARSGLLASA